MFKPKYRIVEVYSKYNYTYYKVQKRCFLIGWKTIKSWCQSVQLAERELNVYREYIEHKPKVIKEYL